MIRFFIAFILFLFPTCIARLIVAFVRIAGGGHFYVENAKIGFSFIISNDIHIGDIRIGHLNFIKVSSLNVDGNIGHLNIIKGNIRLDIQEQSFMKNQNKITNNSKITRDLL